VCSICFVFYGPCRLTQINDDDDDDDDDMFMTIKLKFTEPEVEIHITRTSYIGHQYFVSFVLVMRA